MSKSSLPGERAGPGESARGTEPAGLREQIARAKRFRALHDGPEPLLLPNPWDAGTARLLEALGFSALGTTSLGVALSQGRRRTDREAVLANCRAICAASSLPVTVDLENGFTDGPAGVADCVSLVAAAGAVGFSIEDSTGDPRRPLYELGLARERVAAAASAAHQGPVPMTFTARAEGLLAGTDALNDTIRRLQAYGEAGADVLYAPYIRDLGTMRSIVESLDKPVNVVMGFADPTITLAQLSAIGVRRVSIGGALSRLALRAFLDGAAAMHRGDFRFVADLAPLDELFDAFSGRSKDDTATGLQSAG